METLEITAKSVLTKDRVDYLMRYLAISKNDDKRILKMMELSNLGYTDRMIIDEYYKK